ncbi:MAG: AMIN domain-containing protein [Limnothrix sp.]
MDIRLSFVQTVGLAIAGIGFSAGVAIAGIGFSAGVAIAEDIFPPLQQWHFDQQQQTLDIKVHALASPRYFVLKEPTRIVVDVTDTSWQAGSISRSYSGLVPQIRIAQFSDGVTRFVLDWAGNTIPNGSLPLRSFPQPDGSVLWRLELGNNLIATPTNNISNSNTGFPPALLPPPFRTSVTVSPPPISDNLRK